MRRQLGLASNTPLQMPACRLAPWSLRSIAGLKSMRLTCWERTSTRRMQRAISQHAVPRLCWIGTLSHKGTANGTVAGTITPRAVPGPPFPKTVPDSSFPKWPVGDGETGKIALNGRPLSGTRIARLNVRVWSVLVRSGLLEGIEFRENVRELRAQNGHFLTERRENIKGRPFRDGLSIVSH